MSAAGRPCLAGDASLHGRLLGQEVGGVGPLASPRVGFEPGGGAGCHALARASVRAFAQAPASTLRR
eukprot:7425608-Alexandrium_andersonii.AAC.1